MPGSSTDVTPTTAPTTAPATTSPTVAHPPGAAGPAAASADPWKDFTEAAKAYDGPGIKAKWAALAVGDKTRLKGDGDTQMHVVTTLHKDAVPILGEGGVDFSAMQTVFAAYLSGDFADWMVPLKAHNIFDAFLGANPKNSSMRIEDAKKLGAWVTAATSVADAKKIFSHVYQPVQDSYTRAGWTVAAVPWTVPTIAQLYNRMVAYNLPIGHANTIRGWYKVTQGANYQQPGGALTPVWGALYWGGSMNEVWFTDSQTTASVGAKADGSPDVGGGAGHGGSGWTGHDAAGGTGSATGSTATNPLDHFTNAVLHEIGHGVGDRVEGNHWAETNAYTQFTKKSANDWASDLWSGEFFRGIGDFFGTTDYSQDDVRKYMLDDIAGKTPAAPHGTLPKFLSYIDSNFSGQALYKAWKKAQGNAERYKNPWFVGDKCYAYLSRYGSFTVYNKKAWDARVSDYAMSSPAEFFAEQYTEYYRPCISAGNQADADKAKGSTIREATVKTYLDGVDRRGFDPATGTASGTPVSPGSSSGGGATGAPDHAIPRPMPWP